MYRIHKRQDEIDSIIYSKIAKHIPDGVDGMTENSVKDCLMDCAELKKEYKSLQVAYKLLSEPR